MSSSSTENVTTAAIQGARRVVAEEVAEDLIINVSLRQGGESKTNPDESGVVGDIPHVAAPAVVAEARKPSKFRDTEEGKTFTNTVDPEVLRVAALEDANRIRGATLSIDLDKVGVKDARIIMSEEHKNLGYRPPSNSLAAKAQRSAAMHPDSSLGLDASTLREAARADAERIKADRTINVSTLTAEEVRKLQSEEQKALGYRPPPGSLSAEAQSVIDKRDHETVTKGSSSGPKNRSHRKRRNKKELNNDPASTPTA